MKNFLRNIDFISKEENLRIDRKNRYENIFGGIISFLISISSVIITIYFFLEMFYSQDPNVITAKASENEIFNYTLSKDEIQFFISLEYANSTYYVDESVYTVSGEFTEIYFVEEEGKTKQKYFSKNIDLKRCKDIYDQEEIAKNDLKLPIEYFYCVKPEDQLQLGGIWGSEYFSKVKIFVKKCKNNTLNYSDIPCKPIEEIDKIIENGIVSMYTTNYLIDNRDSKFPVKKTLKNNFDRISNKFTMDYIITYSTNFYNNDLGWVLPSYEVEKFPTIEDFKISQQFGDLDNIIQIQLQTSPIRINYIRSYIRIQDVLTKIGGCIKSLLLIGNALNFFNSYAFSLIDNIIKNHFELLSDNLVEYENGNSSILTDSFKKKVRIEINNKNIRNRVRNEDLNQNSQDNIINVSTKYFKEKKKIREKLVNKSKINLLIFNLLEKCSLFYIFWCGGKKNKLKKLIKTKEDIFSEVLSVENISRLYFEFNFTKMLIFDSKETKKIEDIYADILNDHVRIKSLRKIIYNKNEKDIYFRNWLELDSKEKIDYFLNK